MSAEPAIVLISASDTDLLAARASGAPWRLANPARTTPGQVAGLVAGAYCVIVRLLGGRSSWPDGLAAVLAQVIETGRQVLQAALEVVRLGEDADDARPARLVLAGERGGIGDRRHAALGRAGALDLGDHGHVLALEHGHDIPG